MPVTVPRTLARALAAAVVLSLLVPAALSPPRAEAAIPVFDGPNFGQNVLTALRTAQAIIQRIEMIRHQIEQIRLQVLSLKHLAEPGTAPPAEYEAFLADPLSVWLESTFGLTAEPRSGRLVRSEPRPITEKGGAAGRLAELTGVSEERCAEAIRQGLLAGCRVTHPDTGFPAFAFRVHQFLSRGDTVHASPEAEGRRHITLHKQTFVPGDRKRRLLPLVFCRECGQEYSCVRRISTPRGREYIPRELSDRLDDEGSEAGFLYLSTASPWPTDPQEEIERLPDEWLELHRGAWRVRRARRAALPQPVQVGPDGRETSDGLGGCFLPVPFRFCLSCGVAWSRHPGHRGPQHRHPAAGPVRLAALAPARPARSRGAQAAELHRQPSGCFAPNRPLQRLRRRGRAARSAPTGCGRGR